MPFVYVMHRSNGDMKIGFSYEPARRRPQVEGAIGVLASWEHPQARLVENAAHQLLRPARRDGEWFAVDRYTAFDAVSRAMREIDSEMSGALPQEAQPTADSGPRHCLGYARALPTVSVASQVRWMISRVAQEDLFIEMLPAADFQLNSALKDVRSGDLFFVWSAGVFGKSAAEVEAVIKRNGADLVMAS